MKTFMLHAHKVAITEKMHELMDKYIGIAHTDEEIEKFWHEYCKLDYYLHYLHDCNDCGAKALDWKFLHESGQLCEWAYEHLPEAAPYKGTPMFIDKGQKYEAGKEIKYTNE